MAYLPKNSNLDENLSLNRSNVVDDPSRWKDKSQQNLKTKKTTSKKSDNDRESGDDILLDKDEVKRFQKPNTVTRRGLDNIKDKFDSFPSFVKALRNEYNKDSGLKTLMDSVKDDNSFKKLFNTPLVQERLKENKLKSSHPAIISYLSKRLFISKTKANNVYGLLPEDSRLKLMTVALRQESAQIKRASVPMQQPARAKRVSFSKQELNYIKMNKDLTPTKVTERLNIIFENKRSQASVLNRIKEYRRQK